MTQRPARRAGQAYNTCIVCGTPLLQPMGYAGTDMCGPCCTGEAETLHDTTEPFDPRPSRRNLCRKCGSDNVEHTCVGVIGGSVQDQYDANRHTCQDCGHVTPRKEVT